MSDHPTHGRNNEPREIVDHGSSKRPWHKQKGESAQAFEAFCAYLTLGKERTVKAAAEAIGKNIHTLGNWSKRWSWAMRAAAFEEHYAIMRLEDYVARRDDMYARLESVADKALALAENNIDVLLDEMRQARESGEDADIVVKPEAIPRLLGEAAKISKDAVLGRLAAQEVDAANAESLEERWAEDLSRFAQRLLSGLDLNDEQRKKAEDLLKTDLVGEAQ